MGKEKSVFAIVLGFIFGSPYSILFVGILFFAALISSLYILTGYGMVSATIYGFGAFLVLALIGFVMGKENLQNHWHSFLVFVMFVPGAMLFGWFSDHLGAFGLSLVPLTVQRFSLFSNAWDEGTSAMVSGSYIVAFVALGLAISTSALVYFKGKKKHKR